jgi:hypothetical protein
MIHESTEKNQEFHHGGTESTEILKLSIQKTNFLTCNVKYLYTRTLILSQCPLCLCGETTFFKGAIHESQTYSSV